MGLSEARWAGPAPFLYGLNWLGPKKPDCIVGLVF